ncbi:protein asteroid homolog 1-like [Coregonus clupeaformis]|uniref:protein asteroid homolog 1-like n=1 Tax=Coregonus clupeaformis TaxID=59861 RepID=UPI001BE026CD|nr:protein asteroid homolog 1-like [Coregonus clupeaformis]
MTEVMYGKDGGSNSNKFDTLQKRAQSTIKKAKALAESQNQVSGVLPTLVEYVFKQVLSSLKVQFTQCLCEADQCIATLAQKWKYPVLSDDSDFYIFDIEEGCLPISGFQWKEQSVSDQKHICCQLYTTESFSKEFKINKQLLPVFAVMAGNDNVNLHIWWGDNEDKPQIVNKQVKQAADRFPTFKRLLKWLASFNELREALASVPSLITHPKSDALSKGIEEYQIPPTLPSYLEEFFNNDVAPSRKCLPDHLSVLPDWTVLLLMKGRLSSCIVNVLLHKRMIHRVQVEDFGRPSGYTTSLYIRQVLYGLLLVERPAVKEDDSKGQKRADPSSQSPPEVYVEEYYRKDTQLVKTKVKAILPSGAQQLQLATLDQAPESERLEVFLETLGVSQSTLNGLPLHLRLCVAVTCYWLRRARPRPDRPLLQALLLGLVYGELCRQRKSQRDEGPVLERLVGLIQRGARGLDLGVAHAYSQWQCCMRDGLNLNQLLCFPLPEPQCAWLYRGTLVHQLVAELRRGVNPDSLLMEDPPSEQLYKSMMENLKDDCKDTGGSGKANPEDDQGFKEGKRGKHK